MTDVQYRKSLSLLRSISLAQHRVRNPFIQRHVLSEEVAECITAVDHLHSYEDVCHTLALVPIPRSPRTPSAPSPHLTLNLGAVSASDHTILSPATDSNPQLTKLLNLFFRSCSPCPNFMYTSIQIHSGELPRVYQHFVTHPRHADRYVCTLGRFKGGELWIQSTFGTKPRQVDEEMLFGIVRSSFNQFQCIQGSTLLGSEPCTGTCYLLIFYTCSLVSPSPTLANELATHHFPSHTLLTPPSPRSSFFQSASSSDITNFFATDLP